VEPSPWPLAASIALLTTTLRGVMYFNNYANGGLLLTLGLSFYRIINVIMV
jgi:hypothetical protein